MAKYKMTSEVLMERDAFTKDKEGTAISKFDFQFPPLEQNVEVDEDGDLVLYRMQKKSLLIEHSFTTELKLVGMQVWRGAFLLADFILSNRQVFDNKTVLELGSGVGLSSIIASIFASEVICTDINLGDILNLIKRNFVRNKEIVKSKYSIVELDFLNLNWSKDVENAVKRAHVVMAADVIYDDEITEGFVKTLNKLLNLGVKKTAYVTLEKRYVFTVRDLDSVAPMYEEFLRCVKKLNVQWQITYIPINFNQYFEYDRTKELILMRVEQTKL